MSLGNDCLHEPNLRKLIYERGTSLSITIADVFAIESVIVGPQAPGPPFLLLNTPVPVWMQVPGDARD